MRALNTRNSSAKTPAAKIVAIVAAALLAIGLVYGALAYQKSYWPFTAPSQTDAPLASDRYDNYPNQDKSDDKSADSADKQSTTPSKPGMSVHESDPSKNTSDSSVSFEADREGNSVIIRTQLGAFDRGTCQLEITNGTERYNTTADVIYQPQGSICAGFSVPVSQLGNGTWNIKLKVEGAHTSGSAFATIEIT